MIAKVGSKARGDVKEQLVAEGMSELVVDDLEAVEIHDQEGDGCRESVPRADGLIESVEKQLGRKLKR